MGKIALGYFTPAALVRDVAGFCARVRSLSAMTARGFPLAVQQVRGEDGKCPMAYAVVNGPIPIHVDPPNGNEASSSIFQFVMEAENRPALLTADTSDTNSKAILGISSMKGWGMGCLELRPGIAVHFDTARTWHGISGLPTGETPPQEPGAVILQVPWEDSAQIERALSIARQSLVADGRFADLLR